MTPCGKLKVLVSIWWRSPPTATPPVCKIIDFGKFRYDISKHTKDKRPSGSKLKEIKFRVNIDDHDYLTKNPARRRIPGSGK